MACLKVTLQRSVIGHPQDQKDTVRMLGLRRLHQSKTIPDTPSMRGMLNKVRHLVVVTAAEEAGEEQQ
jgi:large subunit ribosomal protein L30